MSVRYEYWVSTIPSIWDNTAAWSWSSGGVGGAPVPDHETVAIFDKAGSGDCTMSSDIYCAGIILSSPFDGTVFQNARSIHLGINGFIANAGSFIGSGANIGVDGLFILGSASRFKNTDSTLQLHGDSSFSGGFIATESTVTLYSGAKTYGTESMVFDKLEIRDDTRRVSPVVMNGNSFIGRSLTLTSGYLKKGTDSTIHVLGDMYISHDFGSWDLRNNAHIVFDGTRNSNQNLFNEYGGVIPSLTINRDTTHQVICHGSGPVLINGDLNIIDGTFNTNGLGLRVGI